MKVIIDIPDDHKRVVDNLVEDGKCYLLPNEVENQMALAIRNGKVLSDMTNGDMIKAMFSDAQIDYHEKSDLVDDYVTVFIKDCDTCQDYSLDWWNAPYKKGAEK